MRASRPRNRRRVAAVEFAVGSPFMFLLIFGIIAYTFMEQIFSSTSQQWD